MKNITLCGLIVAGACVSFSSCEDFLTITPTDKIVEEDFWKDKNDLDNAVMACYKRMVDNDLLHKYIYWGEERSDNFERSKSTSATGQEANIMNGNLLTTYDQFDWTSMYNAINYCNKVLAHGPRIVQADESFSAEEWKPIQAELITLRALCHFYLVRTFGEVPYVTVDYNNDSQELRLPQSTQLTVLNHIIDDLESVMDDAMLDYGNTIENKGRITKKAVYALLADVYLWRASYKAGNNQPFAKIKLSKNYKGSLKEGETRHEEYSMEEAANDYTKCIEYCDRIIDIAKNEKLEYIQKKGLNKGDTNIELELEDLLAINSTSSSKSYAPKTDDSAYTLLFGTGNADESIFELQVEGASSYNNTMITDLFYNIGTKSVSKFTGSENLFAEVDEEPSGQTSSHVFTKTDYRRWDTFLFSDAKQTSFEIGKYINKEVSQKGPNNKNFMVNNASSSLSKEDIKQNMRSSSDVDANWIVYRLSEVFLMKAEAMSQLYSDEGHLKEAFSYVREVFKRSNPYAYDKSNASGKDSLKFTNFATSENMESLVLKERQREFIGEGKRWYDLVRYALRRGQTAEMLDILSTKYTNSKSIKSKLADMQSLFSPVYNKEIKNNNLLYQNGVWSVGETSSRTDDL